jgi:hypothetical protein
LPCRSLAEPNESLRTPDGLEETPLERTSGLRLVLSGGQTVYPDQDSCGVKIAVCLDERIFRTTRSESLQQTNEIQRSDDCSSCTRYALVKDRRIVRVDTQVTEPLLSSSPL